MMRSFARTFFNRFGASTYSLDSDSAARRREDEKDDELVVELPPELASVFGKPRLYLVFANEIQEKQRELSPAEDLLVYGSRTFDQMLALLAGRGEATQFNLPYQTPLESGQQPTFPLPLSNCRLLESQVNLDQTLFYVFNFRAIYRSDEKQEGFITIALDVKGQPNPAISKSLSELKTFCAPDPPLPVDPEQLRQMLDRATELARLEADNRAAELERALQPRLQKNLLRLTTFYRRLAAEMNIGDPEQDEATRAKLQRDLARKVTDELESRRLRITLSPFSYAMVSVPLARYQLTLATPHTQQIIQLTQNLYSGQMEDLTCHHCGQSLDQLALCDREHLVHPACLSTCCRCNRDICQACGIQPCAICGNPVCADCAAICAFCSRRLCAQHITTCAICGQTYCISHTIRCRLCEQSYCAKCKTAGECNTCHSAVDIPSTDYIPIIPSLKPDHYYWRWGTNRTFVIYIGRGKGLNSLFTAQVVIVTNKAGQVVHWRKISPLTSWLKLFL